jgi:hypothetical protein
MMIQDLPQETRLALDELLELLTGALNAAANDVPHWSLHDGDLEVEDYFL